MKVQVWDGLDKHRNEEDTPTVDDTITVTISVSDVAEKPSAPAVTVTSPVSGTDLKVTWTAPDNTGPAITGYRLECTGTDVPDDQCPKDLDKALVTHTIADLTKGKSYRVRLRAKNDEGDGAWSSWVTQSTNKDSNTLPIFTSPPETVYVKENAPSARQPVTSDSDGNTVVALQGDDTADGDTVTFRLEGPGAGKFDIDKSGQIRTKSKMNHEAECSAADADQTGGHSENCTYSVRVKLSDPNGGSIFHSLTISVTDENEPPAAPSAAPRVTATSGSGWSLEVTWNEPTNTGPLHHRLPDTVPQIRDGTLLQRWDSQVVPVDTHRHGAEGHDKDDTERR